MMLREQRDIVRRLLDILPLTVAAIRPAQPHKSNPVENALEAPPPSGPRPLQITLCNLRLPDTARWAAVVTCDWNCSLGVCLCCTCRPAWRLVALNASRCASP